MQLQSPRGIGEHRSALLCTISSPLLHTVLLRIDSLSEGLRQVQPIRAHSAVSDVVVSHGLIPRPGLSCSRARYLELGVKQWNGR